MKEIYRTIYCSSIDERIIGEEVIVSGWVQNIRDHGGVLFLDLRDETDILQVVSNDDSIFKGLSKASVIRVKGTIRSRSEETINTKIKSGKVELLIDELKVISKSKNVLPFDILSSNFFLSHFY